MKKLLFSLLMIASSAMLLGQTPIIFDRMFLSSDGSLVLWLKKSGDTIYWQSLKNLHKFNGGVKFDSINLGNKWYKTITGGDSLFRWGNGVGSISNQADLMNLLNAKQDTGSVDNAVIELAAAKQDKLQGTGYLKMNGSDATYDNSTFVNVNDSVGGSGTKKFQTVYQTDYLANFKNRVKYNGDTVIFIPNQTSFTGSMFIGSGGGNYLTHSSGLQGYYNIGIGRNTLKYASSTTFSLALGTQALERITTGTGNIGIGTFALQYGSTITANLGIGIYAGCYLTSGQHNVLIGRSTMANGSSGSYNVIIGNGAANYGNFTNSVLIGYQSSLGVSATKGISQTGQIKIGYQAGYSDTTNNRLYIENSNSTTPLIGGDFANDRVGINKSFSTTWKANLNVGGTAWISGAIYQDLLSGSLTDGEPTVDEITSIIGLSPSAATAGYSVNILDTTGTKLIYRIISDGTNWQYSIMGLAAS